MYYNSSFLTVYNIAIERIIYCYLKLDLTLSLWVYVTVGPFKDKVLMSGYLLDEGGHCPETPDRVH